MGRAPGRRPSCALGLSDRRGCCSSFASLVVDAEEAERELARFSMSSLCDVRPRLGAVLLSFMTSDRQGASADSVSALRSSSDR